MRGAPSKLRLGGRGRLIPTPCHPERRSPRRPKSKDLHLLFGKPEGAGAFRPLNFRATHVPAFRPGNNRPRRHRTVILSGGRRGDRSRKPALSGDCESNRSRTGTCICFSLVSGLGLAMPQNVGNEPGLQPLWKHGGSRGLQAPEFPLNKHPGLQARKF